MVSVEQIYAGCDMGLQNCSFLLTKTHLLFQAVWQWSSVSSNKGKKLELLEKTTILFIAPFKE